ncbi:hypothetical protein ACHAQA_007686 [Verticillium albo-atrum]
MTASNARSKSQIALEYAYRRRKRDEPSPCSVFWVHADSEVTFANDYRKIAAKLGVVQRFGNDLDLLEAVRDAIESDPMWVLVIDSADDLSLFGVGDPTGTNTNLEEYLPRGGHGTILWTSRDGQIAELVGSRNTIEVTCMTVGEATSLLADISDDSIAESQVGQDLIEELQWLPLALSQAGAYMRRTHTSVGDYLSMLRSPQDRQSLLCTDLNDRYRRRNVPHSVLKTWCSSIDQIKQQYNVAYRIVQVISFIDNQNITFEILAAASGQTNPMLVREAVTRLILLSFLTPREGEGGGTSYRLHKLVQEATRYGLVVDRENRSDQFPDPEEDFAGVALDIITDVFQKLDGKTWNECALSREAFGNKHPNTLRRSSELAITLLEGGHYRMAEEIGKECFTSQCQVLGDKHPDSIKSGTRLALTYSHMAQFDKAEKFFNKALALSREVLGDEHPETIQSKYGLAWMHLENGQLDEAEKGFVEALTLSREKLGDEHPGTIRSKCGLAWTHNHKGQFDEAEKVFVEALALSREVLCDKHPDTLRNQCGLAWVYHEKGQYDEAEKVFVEALALSRELLGDKHPDTLKNKCGLAWVYYEKGQYDEAEKVFVEALALSREVLGDKHPERIRTQVIALCREVLGDEHPQTLNYRNWQAKMRQQH